MSQEWVFLISFLSVIFMKIVCFIIGFFIIKFGYVLIASGVKGEFKFSANLGGLKTDLASISPGLLFVVLGVALIGYALFIEKPVEVSKSSTHSEAINPLIPKESPFQGGIDNEKNK